MEDEMKTVSGFFLCLFLFASANLFSQSDDASFRKFLDNANDKFMKALTSGDYSTIGNMYTDDAVSMPSYEPMWTGKNAIINGNKKMLTESGMKFSNASGKTIKVLGKGDIRVELGTFQMDVKTPNETTAMTDRGKYMNIWQKQSDGTWKIVADTWNSDINPYTSMNQAGAKSKDDTEKVKSNDYKDH